MGDLEDNKLISARELKKIVARMVELPDDVRVRFIGAINKAEDVVVRCKECKNYRANKYDPDGAMWCKCWGDWHPTDPDDFCSYGERRTE